MAMDSLSVTHSLPQPAPDPLVSLLGAIHDSVRVEELTGRYLAAVPGVVTADAYALYASDPENGRPVRLGQRGGVTRLFHRYEAGAFQQDPLLAHTAETLQPVHEALLFSDEEWQRHGLRRALDARRLMRLLEAPLVLDVSPMGTIFFTRRPDEPPFGAQDLLAAGLIAHHLALATRNAELLADVERRAQLAEEALELVGAGLLVTDLEGNVHHANRMAERLLADGSRSDGTLERRLRENLAGLEAEEKCVGVAVPLDPDAGRLIMRSQRLPERRDRAVTFLYSVRIDQRGCRFSHLLGLLSERQVEVLELIAQGRRTKEIAQKLHVTPDTVQYHLRQMFAVMDARSRAELLAKAQATADGERA